MDNSKYNQLEEISENNIPLHPIHYDLRASPANIPYRSNITQSYSDIPIAYPENNIQTSSNICMNNSYSNSANNNLAINNSNNSIVVSTNNSQMVSVNGIDEYGNNIIVLVPKYQIENTNSNASCFTAGVASAGIASCFLCNIL